MKRWLVLAWLVGLLVAGGVSWGIWIGFPLLDSDMRFGAAVAPILLWAFGFVLVAARTTQSSVVRSGNIAQQARQVVRFLRDAGIRSAAARYGRPLYLVGGQLGSGKSAILEDTQQRISATAEVGDTIWSVSRDAIFVETAIGVPDRQLSSTIDLLRAVRPRLPLSGILLVVSPADLTLADHVEQRTLAQTLAKDLREMDELLGERVPVYLLLSKLDLVPGFQEFFDRYEADERSQPWGFTFSDEGEGEASSEVGLDRGFAAVVEAMRLRHVEWLSREADALRNAHLHSFPAQIAALRHTIAPVVNLLVGDGSQQNTGRRLRGVFLTSARQEALSIDVLLPELSRRFSLPRMGTLPPDLGLDEDHQGFFIKGVLEKVVFPEAGLVTQTKRRRWAWRAAWVCFVAAAMISVWTGHWLLGAFDKEVTRLVWLKETASLASQPANPARLGDILPVLDELRRLRNMRDNMRDDLKEGPAVRTAPFLPELPDLGLPVGFPDRMRGGALRGSIDHAMDEVRRMVLAPHITALYEADLVDLEADVATLRERIALADPAVPPSPSAIRAWLEKAGMHMTQDDHELLLLEGAAAVEAVGLRIDPAYLDAARRIVAYKESLS